MTQRPTSIWVGLGILAVYVPLLAFGIFVPYERSVLDEMELVDEIIFYTEAILMLASFIGAFVAIWMRKLFGRWFLIAPFVYFLGAFGFEQLFYSDPATPAAESADMWIGFAVGFVPALFTFLLVSVGDSAREYFSSGTPQRN